MAKKSGKRLGISESFVMGEKNKVHAFVDFTDAVPGEIYTVHLVWLKPDDHELYRKHAVVSVEETPTGYRSRIRWKKAEDLHYLKEEVQEGSEPAFSIASSFSTYYRGEPRDAGAYKLRVYLHRDLMMEKSFSITS